MADSSNCDVNSTFNTMASTAVKVPKVVEPQKHSYFLSIPIEIRQKILLYTITDEELENDMKSMVIRKDMKVIESQTFDGSLTMFWADQLKTLHPMVEDDMCFVMKEWKSRGHALASEKHIVTWRWCYPCISIS